MPAAVTHLYSGDEFPSASADSPLWLIKPYFPREGIVLLYGKKGVGKSPLTWLLAESVATGTPWLGYAVQDPGQVLYLEVDTPSIVAIPRMRQVITSHDVKVYFPPGSVADEAGWRRLQTETKHLNPKLVVVNTLRKVHAAKDTDSDIPSRVYTRFRIQWPHALSVFVHHEKKTPANPEHEFSRGEEFSGSLAWANDAQVVLRLWRYGGRPAKAGQETILGMSGNQLAPLAEPVRFLLINGLVGPNL